MNARLISNKAPCAEKNGASFGRKFILCIGASKSGTDLKYTNQDITLGVDLAFADDANGLWVVNGLANMGLKVQLLMICKLALLKRLVQVMG